MPPAVTPTEPPAVPTPAPRGRRRPDGRGTATALLVAVLVAVGGCGDDDTGDGAAGTTTTAVDGGDLNGGSPGSAGALDGPAPAIAVDDLATAAGGASAVADVALDDPPGDPARSGLPDVTETAASITAADGTETACCLLVASDGATRQRGLMEVTDLAGYQGMVFVWDADSSGGFWMKNTVMPLSIAYFTADGSFLDAYDMEPCPDGDLCEAYPSPGSYRFAIEVPQGELDDLGVGPGSRLTLGGACVEAS